MCLAYPSFFIYRSAEQSESPFPAQAFSIMFGPDYSAFSVAVIIIIMMAADTCSTRTSDSPFFYATCEW